MAAGAARGQRPPSFSALPGGGGRKRPAAPRPHERGAVLRTRRRRRYPAGGAQRLGEGGKPPPARRAKGRPTHRGGAAVPPASNGRTRPAAGGNTAASAAGRRPSTRRRPLPCRPAGRRSLPFLGPRYSAGPGVRGPPRQAAIDDKRPWILRGALVGRQGAGDGRPRSRGGRSPMRVSGRVSAVERWSASAVEFIGRRVANGRLGVPRGTFAVSDGRVWTSFSERAA